MYDWNQLNQNFTIIQCLIVLYLKNIYPKTYVKQLLIYAKPLFNFHQVFLFYFLSWRNQDGANRLHLNKVSKTTCGEIALYTVFIIFIVKVQFIRSKLRYNLWRMLSKSLPKRCNLLQGLLLLEKLLLFMSKGILGSKLRILCR